MDGTLTISGPLDALSAIAADLGKRYPDGVSVEVSGAHDVDVGLLQGDDPGLATPAARRGLFPDT